MIFDPLERIESDRSAFARNHPELFNKEEPFRFDPPDISPFFDLLKKWIKKILRK